MNVVPAKPTASDVSRCGTGTVVLSATAPGATVAWFSVATGGTQLSTANPYTTASISVNTTYYVESRTTTCISATRTAVLATVNPLPAAPTGTAGSNCGTGTVVISAIPPSGSTIDWYSASTGGAVLASGSGVTSFTTPSISATTTYYAASRNLITGCVSATRTAVRATINQLLAASASITGLTAICPIVGTTTTTNYTAAAITGATTYKWTLPAGATIIGVTTGRTITVQYNSVVTSASITVQGVASTGCAGNPKSLALNTTGCAALPVVLSTSNTAVKAVTPLIASIIVKVFPNPSRSSFNLTVESSSSEAIQMRVVNALGTVLKKYTLDSSKTLTFGDELFPGTYLIQVSQGANFKVLRAVKL